MSMTSVTKQRWPRGTGQWSRTRILVAATDPRERERLVVGHADQHEVVAASSPLEVIRRLETDPLISTVIISDVWGSVCRNELVSFIEETYPYLRVILTERPHREHDIQLAQYA